MVTPEDILTFWFKEITPKQWWLKDPAFDELIAARFSVVHLAAVAGELNHWRTNGTARLAEIIILDQFSRNIYRDQPQSFAADGMALALAQEAVRQGLDKELNALERSFLYMPYMHSESRLIHQQAETLYRDNGIDDNLKFEVLHRQIIDRFGRYPHRNDILGRVSTPQEKAFLLQPGSKF